MSGVLTGCSHLHSHVSGRTIGSFCLRKTLGNLVQSGRVLGEPFRQALAVYLCP